MKVDASANIPSDTASSMVAFEAPILAIKKIKFLINKNLLALLETFCKTI